MQPSNESDASLASDAAALPGVDQARATKSLRREYGEALAIALVLALVIRTFIVQAFKIPSGSMLPTLQIGDHILVNKLAYGVHVPLPGRAGLDADGKLLLHFGTPAAGDVVVFVYPA